MILIALGANLPGMHGETPEQTLQAALAALSDAGVRVVKTSSVWLSAPVPISDQPWYRNAVIEVETALAPEALISKLQGIEQAFGRERGERDAARVLDLDIIAYNDMVLEGDHCTVPHPRMHERAFVLKPLEQIKPGWLHPKLGFSVSALIEAMPAGQEIEKGAALEI